MADDNRSEMQTVEDYLRHAVACDALARKAISPEQRDMIEHMAATWRLLAEERRAVLLKQRSTGE